MLVHNVEYAFGDIFPIINHMNMKLGELIDIV